MKKNCKSYLALLLLLFLISGCAKKDAEEIVLPVRRSYVEAFTDFLLYADIEPGHDFPIRGYYLFDLNFDGVPELGILHDSGGSMGGYFTYYYFDGKEVKAVSDNSGEAATVSNYTRLLADLEQEKVYLLKEMYLLQGNDNGTYGYVREIKNEGQIFYVEEILNLSVDQNSNLMSHYEKEYGGEDDFLSDPELEDCLITQYYYENEWIDISPDEYLKQKRELIPEVNSFVNLLDSGLHYPEADYGGEGFLPYTDVRMNGEEINQLFLRYTQSVK